MPQFAAHKPAASANTVRALASSSMQITVPTNLAIGFEFSGIGFLFALEHCDQKTKCVLLPYHIK
jgi:hypothetical protein